MIFSQRYRATEPDDEVGLTAAIIGYATKYGRYMVVSLPR